MSDRTRWLSRVTAIGWAVFVTVIALRPSSNTAIPFPGFDKLLHFTAFLVMASLIYIAWEKPPRWLYTVVIPSIYGGIIELLQTSMPSREGEVLDLLSDVAGCVTAFFILNYSGRIVANRVHRHRD